jgi:hypothetical protein
MASWAGYRECMGRVRFFPREAAQRFMCVSVWVATYTLDVCAIAALLDGATNHTLYAPLAVGYGITALSAICIVVLAFFRIAGAIRSCLARLCK